jgi:uncharacterized protein involved in exopolysaccharide biosynthesis
MELSNQQTNEDQINILIFIEILFSLLSQRFLIILSLIIFTFLGIIYNYCQPGMFQTNATLLITKDQSDPSSFLLNNENEFLYNKYVDREDQASVFK